MARLFPIYISEYHSEFSDVVDEYNSFDNILKEVNATFQQHFTTKEEVDKYIEENTNFNDVPEVYFYTIINSEKEYEEYYKYEW